MPVSLPNSSHVEKWMGELHIIMQSANLPYKKVQNKHGKQLNFMYLCVVAHKRTCETCFTLICQNKIELLVPIKIQNDCDSLELIC